MAHTGDSGRHGPGGVRVPLQLARDGRGTAGGRERARARVRDHLQHRAQVPGDDDPAGVVPRAEAFRECLRPLRSSLCAAAAGRADGRNGQNREDPATKQANAQTRKIGLELIEQRRAAIAAENASEKEGVIEGDKTGLDRDLLSVLSKSNFVPVPVFNPITHPRAVRSNISEEPSKRMSVNEILCQISTFLAAGHETSSSALAWVLYALGRAPGVQARLREELRTVALPAPFSTPSQLPSSPLPPHTPPPRTPRSPASPRSPVSPSPAPAPEPELLAQVAQLPYLDAVVREGLRLYTPVTTTMRVAAADDAIPVAAPFVDARGRECGAIEVRRGDIISVSIQAMNSACGQWGEDAGAFRPERWLAPADAEEGKEAEGRKTGGGGLHGMWANMLTFGCGSPVNGNRACIGYRFAVSECVAFLFLFLEVGLRALADGVVGRAGSRCSCSCSCATSSSSRTLLWRSRRKSSAYLELLVPHR